MRTMARLLIIFLALGLAACSGSGVKATSEMKAAEANADLGLRYMLQGNNELALEKLKRALEFDDASVKANHYIAELYRRLGRDEDADQHFRRALRYSAEDNSSLYNNYGVFLCSRKEYDDAEEQFQHVLQNPVYRTPDEVYENMGVCVMQKPDVVKAEGYFRKALEMNPKRPNALLGMARINFDRGKALSARAYIQRYLEVGPRTAEMLWLAIRTERKLGDKNAVASYGLQLKNNHPDAEETRLYLESEKK